MTEQEKLASSADEYADIHYPHGSWSEYTRNIAERAWEAGHAEALRSLSAPERPALAVSEPRGCPTPGACSCK